MEVTLKRQVIIKVKDLPANRFANCTFCELIICTLAKKNIKEILYCHITSQVVQQISDYLFPESERRTVCPHDEYPYLMDYIPQQYIKPDGVDRESIYQVLVEKDAEFVLNLPDEETLLTPTQNRGLLVSPAQKILKIPPTNNRLKNTLLYKLLARAPLLYSSTK